MNYLFNDISLKFTKIQNKDKNTNMLILFNYIINLKFLKAFIYLMIKRSFE